MNDCWFINQPKPLSVTLVYVHPVVNEAYQDVAKRFVQTCKDHPPGYDHRTLVMCNGGRPPGTTQSIFSELPVELIPRDNSGFDLGAYQHASKHYSDCDIMVFFGASTYFRKSGWLKRMVESYQKHGETLYGAMSNYGSQHNGCYPHIRTTAMWTSPALMNDYPHKVTRPEQRYAFEHGPECLTGWVAREGMTPLTVTFNGEYEWAHWTSIPGGFHNGNQENLLCGDRMSCPPYFGVS